jgi:hypothetical protein
MLIGVALMVFPYFIGNLYLMAGIALALVAGLWVAVRVGW